MNYDQKQVFKNILEKLKIYDLFFYCYRLKHYLRHKKCEINSKKRSSGKIDKRYIRLKQYEKIHNGERCFIIATGPSLTVDDLEKLKNEYTFSMNSIYKIFDKTDWRPTYFGIQDKNVYNILSKDIRFCELRNKFIADIIADEFSVSDDSILVPLDMMNHLYYKLKTFDTKFSDNAYSIIYDGGTITYTLMQLAVYMGFKEIYLLGCDCDYNGEKQHFADYGLTVNINDRPEAKMFNAYKTAKEYADKHDIKIYNASRGGKLEIFERVNFDELFSISRL